MTRDPVYAQMYQNKIEEYTEKGYIKKLSKLEAESKSGKEWIIPHFGVYNVNKPGKIRLVFDAAAKSGGVSLNDHLLPGPDLIRPLVAVLWNFRRHNVAITGDIEDMFHRILIRAPDQRSQMFLWRKSPTEPIDTYVMRVMIFGACSSPASAIYVKNWHAKLYEKEFPDAARVIKEDMYVDDCLSGAPTPNQAYQLCRQIVDINQAAGFAVKKWMSNSKEVISAIPEDYRAAGVKGFNEKAEIPTERVLGLWWNPEKDVFTFTTNFKKVKPEVLDGDRPTKREMLSLTMSVFDPLGFLGNFKVKGMMLLQRTWKTGIDWDDGIPDSIYDDWQIWVNNLKLTPNVQVPRCYGQDLQDATSLELHTIVDASEEGYAAVVYLRSEVAGKVKVSFVQSKVRVAPTRKQTIPRLELMAALLGARLACSITEELKIPISRHHYWSDSKLVLLWIRSETLRYKEFLANRIGEIQDTTNVKDWHWIPTGLNVADCATRLKSPLDLRSDSLWLTGPLFLQKDPSAWPKENRNDVVQDEEQEIRASINVMTAETTDKLSASRYSSYNRLIRVQAAIISTAKFWLEKTRGSRTANTPWSRREKLPKMADNEEPQKYMRRIGKFLYENTVSKFSPEIIEIAEIMQVKAAQAEEFSDEIAALRRRKLVKSSRLWKLSPTLIDGILCVAGRIGAADTSEGMKNPMILPARHRLTELLILREHQRNGHQGVATVMNTLRQKFWILEGRSAVQRVFRNCKECRIRKTKPIVPKMGALPHYRLAAGQPPFTFTGVDYFGPMEVVVGRHHEKRWGCLFTCMVTRAIHIEVAYALSTDEMLMALSRFIDTRGKPRHMYSDNGLNLVGGNNELKRQWETINWEKIRNRDLFQRMDWSHTPPLCAHFGGAWERMIQNVKKVLKITLKEKFPKDQTLLTVLKGVENIVNSRPLTYVSPDPSDPESLTPNHFLRGAAYVGPSIVGEFGARDDVLRVQWRRAQYLLDQFWERWSKEVLPEMIRRQKWHEDAESLQVGDLVLMVDDQQPRNTWTKGVITGTFPGTDGQVRVVEVTTSDFTTRKKTTYKRGVDKVCPLGLRMEKFD